MKEEIKVNAINLKSVDYMESDKLITLFSYQGGLLSARMKGVKKAQAKLKFASEPFCFGAFSLAGGKGGYIVTGCDSEELFYGLREDYNKYLSACAALEFCLNFVQEDQPNTALFTLLLRSLNTLCYSETDTSVVLLHFLLSALKCCGYAADYSRCASCGEALEGINPEMSLSGGGFFCKKCKDGNENTVPAAVYKIFKFISDTNPEKLSTIKAEKKNTLSALSHLARYIAEIAERGNRSLAEYIRAVR